MASATHTGLWAWLAGPAPQARTGPARKPRPAPIFIHDAVVPWKGSTVLCEMMLQDLEDADSPQEPLSGGR